MRPGLARSVTRSVFIAAPVIALMFVLGTSAVVAYVLNNDIDLIGPVAQVLRVGSPLRHRHAAGDDGDSHDAGDACRASECGIHRGETRLPMVAGWDHLLPAWFSRLHATSKTPVNSITLVGAASFGIASLSLVGVGQAEAFQLVFSASGIFSCAHVCRDVRHPVVRDARCRPEQPPMWLRLASVSVCSLMAVRRGHRALGVPDHQGRRACPRSPSRSR